MSLHYRSEATGHHGEAPWEHIRGWIDRGDLSPDTLVSRDGVTWHPAGEFDPAAPAEVVASKSETQKQESKPHPSRAAVYSGDTVSRRFWCDHCRDYRIAKRSLGISDGTGCLLSLVTLGLFLPIFLLLRLINSSGSYHCATCGAKCIRAHRPRA